MEIGREQGRDLSYRVKRGDSLARIARDNWNLLVSLGVVPETATVSRESLEAAALRLAQMNNLSRPELIKPGQVITFGGRAAPLQSPDPQTKSRPEHPRIPDSSGLEMPMAKQKVKQDESFSYNIERGGNLNSAAKANWDKLQALGTIPKDWRADDSNKVHLAALKLASLNSIAEPSQVKPGRINLANLPSGADISQTPQGKADSQQPSPILPAAEHRTAIPPSPDMASKSESAAVPLTESGPQPQLGPEPRTAEKEQEEKPVPAPPVSPGLEGDKPTEILFPDQKPNPALVAKAVPEPFYSQLTSTSLKRNENGFISILLLGKDDEGRPDIIKQMLIDPTSKKTALIDVPRDLRINAPGNHKLNGLGKKDVGKLARAVEEITGQSSTYIATLSMRDMESFKPVFASMFPDGVTLPSKNRYYHSLSGQIFEPNEKITDISRLEDYVRMRHAYIVAPEWKIGDSLDGQKKLSGSDTERQQRQSELIASLRSQVGVFNTGKAIYNFSVDKIFRPEDNPDPVTTTVLGGLLGRVAISGEEMGRFQPSMLGKYTRDGSEVDKAKGRTLVSSFSIDINGLRQQVKDHFSG